MLINHRVPGKAKPRKQSNHEVHLVTAEAGGLLLGCCFVGDVVGWFFYFRGAAAEKNVVGLWEADPEPSLKRG
jgi:hypothetical protein